MTDRIEQKRVLDRNHSQYMLLMRMGEQISSTELDAFGVTARIDDYKLRDDVFRVVMVNDVCVSVATLDKEVHNG